MKMPITVAVLLASLAVAGLRAQEGAPAESAAGAVAAPAGNVETGKKLFVGKACYQCHGYEGQGSASLGGPRVGPNPIPYGRFVAYVRKPLTEMPPYSPKVLSEQELADIYAFLRARPMPPPVRDIPLLAK